MAIQIFEYKNYKEYLTDRLDEIDNGSRGARSNLSRAIGCQTAYTAQVLRGTAHFSPEQGEEVNHFFGHTDEECNYFLLILNLGRAGTQKLKQRLLEQIDAHLKSRMLLKNRSGFSESLTDQHRVIYYSSWFYGAIHALVSVPGFQTPERIAERLKISVKNASEAIDFLVKAGLLIRDNRSNLKIGKGQVHLGSDSSLISKHHSNWRMQAMKSLELGRQEDLHYSSVISISKKDEVIVREKLIEALSEIKPIIKKSKEEEVCSLSLDFFRL